MLGAGLGEVCAEDLDYLVDGLLGALGPGLVLVVYEVVG